MKTFVLFNYFLCLFVLVKCEITNLEDILSPPPHSPRVPSKVRPEWIQISDDCLMMEPEHWPEDDEEDNNADNRSTDYPCGRSKYDKDEESRIVGGNVVQPHSHPWSVALKLHGILHYCGGSIIKNKFVLTAAHCVGWGLGALNTTLHIGDHSMNEEDPGEMTRKVRRIMMHKSYNARNTDYDIAIIEMDRAIEYGDNVRPVCLPEKDQKFTGRLATVAGWGYTSENGRASEELRSVSVKVLDDAVCRRRYRRDDVTERMLCAGDNRGGRDACQGDSGGALITEIDSNWVQMGIVSWGRGCALPQYPGVYTRVSYFTDWIEKYTK